ncbi:MAG: hypothetical protein IJK54_08710, partial [Clostridia bacterium]|nr:hypothetical protein [Clostridia bacterium]
MKRIIAVILTMLLVLLTAACGGASGSGNTGTGTVDDGQPKTGVEAIDAIGEDGVDWNHMSMEELYEMAKQEGGVVKIYATTTD